MNKSVSIKAIRHKQPDLRKLARALLLLVEQDAVQPGSEVKRQARGRS